MHKKRGGDFAPSQSISMFGGAERDRTADLVNAIHALSQLSYGPVVVWRQLTHSALEVKLDIDF